MQSNRLIHEASPYLLQHAHNPVDWYPWGTEAFDKAQKEGKPIFLSIGYATCHWCHVMERESFENEEIAAYLNENFVSIKVDREERPDIDKIYMVAVQAMVGQGGWPLSVWLTPDRKPFYGGTYFPPTSTAGRPGFVELLQKIQDVWKTKNADLTGSAGKFAQELKAVSENTVRTPRGLIRDDVLNAGEIFQKGFDVENGGFGVAPKFPRPSTPLFLFKYADSCGDPKAADMVKLNCKKMIAGGIHDQLGGGFHRYSVDEKWLVPHFEKMLYDNAQLLYLFSEIYQSSPDQELLDAIESTHQYLVRDMKHPEGGFYSAEDADSEGREGVFYVWTKQQLEKVLTSDEVEYVCKIYGITPQGNFVDHSDPAPLSNQNVLSRAALPASKEEMEKLNAIKLKLLQERAKRKRPLRDDKILTAWNGLLIAGYARAYDVTGVESYLKTADEALRFIEKNLLRENGTLAHRWRDGRVDGIHLLEDYSFLIWGLIELYEATLEWSYAERASKITQKMIELFYDQERGGFWQRDGGDESLLARLKEDYDGAEPSGNSVAVYSLLKLSHILGKQEYRDMALKSLNAMAANVVQMPEVSPFLLMALDFATASAPEIVFAGDRQDKAFQELRGVLRKMYISHKSVLYAEKNNPDEFIRSLAEKCDKPTVYICENGACKLPVTDSKELYVMLSKAGGLTS